jgi:hypothetical protein
MPKPRSVLRQFLDLMKRDDLVVLAERIGVTLSQKREVETIRQEVWGRRTKIVADLSGALAALSKATLANLCQSFELDVSSGHKETLVSTLADFLQHPDDFEYTEEVAEDDEESDDEPEELNADEAAMFRKVPGDGSTIGNGRLRKELDWKEGKYWKIRDSLVEKGHLALGFGRGGSVYRVLEDEVVDEDEDEVPEEDTKTEAPSGYDRAEEVLYAPILAMLKANWQQLFPGFPAPTRHWVDSSPRLGRRMTGGRWTRPDLSAITLNKYRYIPGTHLEVFSFEVKPRGQFNVLGLYEALGHSRRANFAYVLFHILPESELRPNQRDEYVRALEEIKREAARLKIGVATFEDPAGADTWTVHQVPGRHDPEPRFLNDFIESMPELLRKDIEFNIR